MQDAAKTIANTIPRPANKESWTSQWDRYLPTEATLSLDLGSMQHARTGHGLICLIQTSNGGGSLAAVGLSRCGIVGPSTLQWVMLELTEGLHPAPHDGRITGEAQRVVL
jgi:hypothetical protein